VARALRRRPLYRLARAGVGRACPRREIKKLLPLGDELAEVAAAARQAGGSLDYSRLAPLLSQVGYGANQVNVPSFAVLAAWALERETQLRADSKVYRKVMARKLRGTVSERDFRAWKSVTGPGKRGEDRIPFDEWKGAADLPPAVRDELAIYLTDSRWQQPDDTTTSPSNGDKRGRARSCVADYGNSKRPLYGRFLSGASRARTGDLLHAMQALSQLSYGPVPARSLATQ
jgi:hypothetical protein